MKKRAHSDTSIAVLLIVLVTILVSCVNSQSCRPNGKLRGRKPPRGACNTENFSDCCEAGKFYNTYSCSPKVTARTKAILTLNSFEKNGDGGGPSECDNKFHSDDSRVVALSSGWFDNRKRCKRNIIIHGNGKSVKARVVDECDSKLGCDKAHDFQPPCENNIVDGSKAVWKALGVPEREWGTLEVHWSDA